MPPIFVCMHACIKTEGRLENKKIFDLKNEGYRDGIKRKETRKGWHCTFGIARCGILHTIQVDDVILILSPN